MNDEQAAVQQLLSVLQSIHVAVQTLTKNQERLMQEQARAAKAIGEAGLLLKNQGAAIIRLWHEAGLPVDESDAPPMTN